MITAKEIDLCKAQAEFSTRKVPMKGFKSASYISSSFPKLLGAMDVTRAPSQAVVRC